MPNKCDEPKQKRIITISSSKRWPVFFSPDLCAGPLSNADDVGDSIQTGYVSVYKYHKLNISLLLFYSTKREDPLSTGASEHCPTLPCDSYDTGRTLFVAR